jgi:hypothetical protein
MPGIKKLQVESAKSLYLKMRFSFKDSGFLFCE